MIPVLSVENMRKSDALAIRAGDGTGLELMRRAGEAIFAAARWEPPVAVVCGAGNNAGDGFVLARLLLEHGTDCTVFLLSNRFSPAGRHYFDLYAAAGGRSLRCETAPDLRGFRTVADCIFGTGFKGTAEGLYAQAIEAINQSGARVVSADINSGLGGDSGMGENVVRSDLTVSVGAFQPGHFLNMAKDVMREKTCAEIGIPPADPPYWLAEAADVKKAFVPRFNFSNKSTYGYVGLMGGSENYIGAVKLAAMANAAMRGGAGVVRLGAPASVCAALRPEVLEVTLFPLSEQNGGIAFREEEAASFVRGLKAVAFGMGAGLSAGAAETLSWLLTHYEGTLVVDADGLTLLSRMPSSALKNAACRLILTPHNMEFSRLSGRPIPEILADPIGLARAYAAENGVCLLLKGPATVVTDGARVVLTDRGCPGMATAGSGDVLSGILAALCGSCEDLLQAACAAAWINGRAGELAELETGPVSQTAGDTAAHTAAAVAELTRGGAAL